jgi:HlyD family secretion protein
MKKKRTIRFIGIAVAVVVLLIILSTLLSKKKKDSDFDRKIDTEEVTFRDITVMVNEIGIVEPKVMVEVKSKLGGKAVTLMAEEGDTVERGQILGIVEPDINDAQLLAQIKNNLKKNRFSMNDALRNLENEQELHRKGYSSDDELKARELAYEEAVINCNQALEQYRILVQSGIPVDDTGEGIQKINIVSPIEGIVISRNVEEGEMVTSGLSSFNAGTVVYEVADLNRMIVRAAVNEVDVGKLHESQDVSITVDAFPGSHFRGTITYIALAARQEERVRVFDVEIDLLPHDSLTRLRTGMTANIEIVGEQREQVLSIPIEALFKKRDRNIVYVKRPEHDTEMTKDDDEEKETPTDTSRVDSVKSPGHTERVEERAEMEGGRSFGGEEEWRREFEERRVTIGLVDLDNVEILSGLSSGEMVAVEDPTIEREEEEE